MWKRKWYLLVYSFRLQNYGSAFIKIGPQCVLVWDFIQIWYGLNNWHKLFCFLIQSLLRNEVLQFDSQCEFQEGESKHLSFQRTQQKLTWRVDKCPCNAKVGPQCVIVWPLFAFIYLMFLGKLFAVLSIQVIDVYSSLTGKFKMHKLGTLYFPMIGIKIHVKVWEKPWS